ASAAAKSRAAEAASPAAPSAAASDPSVRVLAYRATALRRSATAPCRSPRACRIEARSGSAASPSRIRSRSRRAAANRCSAARLPRHACLVRRREEGEGRRVRGPILLAPESVRRGGQPVGDAGRRADDEQRIRLLDGVLERGAAAAIAVAVGQLDRVRLDGEVQVTRNLVRADVEPVVGEHARERRVAVGVDGAAGRELVAAVPVDAVEDGEVGLDLRHEARPGRRIGGGVVLVLGLVGGLSGDESEGVGERGIHRGAAHAVDLRGADAWLLRVASAGGEEDGDGDQAFHGSPVHLLVLAQTPTTGPPWLTMERSTCRTMARTFPPAKLSAAGELPSVSWVRSLTSTLAMVPEVPGLPRL